VGLAGAVEVLQICHVGSVLYVQRFSLASAIISWASEAKTECISRTDIAKVN
jgi:hypothetical protein